jgi:hypothetical protein
MQSIMESKQQKPNRRILRTIIISVVISIVMLWVAGAVATETTDGKSFLNNPTYTPQSGIVQKMGYDLSHPLGFLSNLENDHKKVTVPSTFTEIISQTAQAALDHATGKDGSTIDYASTDQPVITVSETMFQATANGTTISDSQLSFLLENAIKPFNESTLTADVSLLFPIKNPGDQIITIDKIANTEKGGNIDGVIGPSVSIDWETRLTIPDKGSEIIVPINATVCRTTSKTAVSKFSPIDTVSICFEGADGTNYELSIYEEDYNGDYLPFPSGSILPVLAVAPVLDGDTYNPFDSNIQKKVLPEGTPILKTVNNNIKIGFSLRCDKKVAWPDFNFLSSAGKLIYLP